MVDTLIVIIMLVLGIDFDGAKLEGAEKKNDVSPTAVRSNLTCSAV